MDPTVAPLHCVVMREQFMDFCTVTLDDGSTEELEYEELRQWMLDRGADSEKIEKSILDEVWGWPRPVEVYIKNPKSLPVPKNRVTPVL